LTRLVRSFGVVFVPADDGSTCNQDRVQSNALEVLKPATT
jgi:hypothetical protein